MNFADRMCEAVDRTAPVVVALDPRLHLMPPVLVDSGVDERRLSPVRIGELLRAYCCELIERLAGLVPAVSLPVTSFDRFGRDGLDAFFDVAVLARKRGLLVIADGRRPCLWTQSGVPLLGRSNLVRHVWDVDALATGLQPQPSSIEPYFRVASETGKGVFVHVSCDSPKDRIGLAEERVVRQIGRMADGLRGQSGYSWLGVTASISAHSDGDQLRSRLPCSLLMLQGAGRMEAGNGGPETGESVHPRAFGLQPSAFSLGVDWGGLLATASRELTCCYLREPWRRRYCPEEWASAVEFATRDWIDRLRAPAHADAAVLSL
jgi:orotidine-5'-phosphate decarboxylase